MSWSTDFTEILDANRSLAPMTTWRIGGRAQWFFVPRTATEAARLLARLENEGRAWQVLGGGANVLVDDGVHATPIIHTGGLDATTTSGDDGLFNVGAGVSFPRFVADSVRSGFGGLESFAGIPGQMGGICAMNAGGHWGEIRDVVENVEMALVTGDVVRLEPADVSFSYRRAHLPRGIVTAVTLRLEADRNPADLMATRKEVIRKKGATQPLALPSGGCVFVNPESIPAGKLVDELGLKGLRVGDAEVSSQHGNFIVNHGAARFRDVMELVETIEARALRERSITLRREVKVWPVEGGTSS